jgi:hypothetical protein
MRYNRTTIDCWLDLRYTKYSNERFEEFCVLTSDELTPTSNACTQRELELLRRELNDAHALIRSLRRQLEKALAAAQEAQRAHAKMVETLTETMRENTILCHERDMWRARAQRLEASLHEEQRSKAVIDISSLAGQISEDEVNAIRKAMARLHHPDVGGDPERMKAWNAALDRLFRQ